MHNIILNILQIHATKKYHVTQHLNSGIHNKKLANKTNKQLLIQNCLTENSKPGPSKSTFLFNLCDAFISASIPLNKLNNPVLKKFLESTTQEIIPDESTLRKNYVDLCYQSVSTRILWNKKLSHCKNVLYYLVRNISRKLRVF